MMNKGIRAGLIAGILSIVMQLTAVEVAAAAKVAGIAVGGKVTAASGRELIVVNGRRYLVDPQSPAATAMRRVDVGDEVDLVLSGPPSDANSRVVGISIRSGR